MSGEWDSGLSHCPFVQDCMASAGSADATTEEGQEFTDLCDGPLYQIAWVISRVEAGDASADGLRDRLIPHIEYAIGMLRKMRGGE